SDPVYRDTPLVSGIPPPSARTLPRQNQNQNRNQGQDQGQNHNRNRNQTQNQRRGDRDWDRDRNREVEGGRDRYQGGWDRNRHRDRELSPRRDYNRDRELSPRRDYNRDRESPRRDYNRDRELSPRRDYNRDRQRDHGRERDRGRDRDRDRDRDREWDRYQPPHHERHREYRLEYYPYERPQRPDRSERPERPERPERLERPERPERSGRSERLERPGHDQRREAHPLPPRPVYTSPAKPRIELKMNTEFMTCKEGQRLDEEGIRAALKIRSGVWKPSEEDYDLFCSANVVAKLLEVKTRLSATPHPAFTAARCRANPFEKIGTSVFVNRAAVKLACLDALFNLTRGGMASTGETEFRSSFPPPPTIAQTFMFADLCGGPGGFSEYLLWRTHTYGAASRGFGITLAGGAPDKEWAVGQFVKEADAQACFTVVEGVDGSGNLYHEPNMREFARVVLDATHGRGVDLIVADGVHAPCFVCRCLSSIVLCALELNAPWVRSCCRDSISSATKLNRSASRAGSFCAKSRPHLCGTFVLKLFDLFRPFTAALVWLLRQHFEGICITKPVVSRPANSERYIVCRALLPAIDRRQGVIDHLLAVNTRIGQQGEDGEEVLEVMDKDVVMRDEAFVEWIRMESLRNAVKQIDALEELERDLKPRYDQQEIRHQCLVDWRLPLDEPKKQKNKDKSPSSSAAKRALPEFDEPSAKRVKGEDEPVEGGGGVGGELEEGGSDDGVDG
ncbi:FtsJ-like methyltransferase-domain-containing protein, partial [Jimgerdemannia flammicorona]